MLNNNSIKNSIVDFVFQFNKEKDTCSSLHLVSSQELEERAKVLVEHILQKLESDLNKGFIILKEEITLMPPLEREKALSAYQRVIEMIESWKLNENDANLEQLPNDICESIYQIGRGLVLKKNYEGAATVFTILQILRPEMEQIWLGLAISEQRLSHFDKARIAYQQVLFLNPFHEYSKRALENMQ